MRLDTQDPTLTSTGEPGADPGELRLLVSADGVLGAHLLGGRATVRLGRGSDNDIDVGHPSVSRRHAELVLDPLAVRDLGSSNGTAVRGRRIAAGVLVPVAIGEAIHVGDVAVLVHRVARTDAVRTQPDADFERLVAAATARAARTGVAFAVVRIHATGAASGDHAAALAAALASLGSAPDDVAADSAVEVGPGQHQLLITGDAARTAAVVDRIRAGLDLAGVPVRIGIAAWPETGVSPEQLAARAWQQATAGEPAPAATAMDEVRALIARVADSQLSVLIRGETGVGKELCAEMLHRMSGRRTRPFLKVRCAALGDGQLESELFGHQTGAASTAAAGRAGLLEIADGGTVFFDEIGDMPLAVQAKLLHVLEDRVVKRVGSSDPRPVDIRMVAASSRLLERDITRGTVRRDLYFRLAGVTVEVPPLRARRDELEGLARAFAAFACHAARRPTPVLASDAIAALADHAWPGNVRELRHTIERAILVCSDGVLRSHHLRIGGAPAAMPATLHPRDGSPPAPADADADAAPTLRAGKLHDQIADLERDRIREALVACGGNQSHAARMLGIARGTLRARMREFGLWTTTRSPDRSPRR